MAGTFFLSLRPRKLPLRLAVHHRSLEPSADPAAALEPCPALRASHAGGAAPPLPVQLLRRRPSGPVLTAMRAWLTRHRRVRPAPLLRRRLAGRPRPRPLSPLREQQHQIFMAAMPRP